LQLLARLLVGGCLVLAGCRGEQNPTSEVPEEPPSPDERVLQALEPYDPVYRLNPAGRVVALKLEGRQIPATALDEVAKLTELSEELSLYAASIDDDSLSKLQGLKKVYRLGLGATPITEKGLAHLEALTQLRHLWLSRPLATSPEAEKLKESLQGLTIHPQ
jgi:hypothetical protein